jgi:hypothetical protein
MSFNTLHRWRREKAEECGTSASLLPKAENAVIEFIVAHHRISFLHH